MRMSEEGVCGSWRSGIIHGFSVPRCSLLSINSTRLNMSLLETKCRVVQMSCFSRSQKQVIKYWFEGRYTQSIKTSIETQACNLKSIFCSWGSCPTTWEKCNFCHLYWRLGKKFKMHRLKVKTHGLLRCNRLGFVFRTYLLEFFLILQKRIQNR